MIDLTPNDLSHLSDEEFNALCPQGYHATGPAESLSPAAQAVLDAAFSAYWSTEQEAPNDAEVIAAAALRAAADQVVPIPRLPYDSCCDVHAAAIRAELLAIAAEMEGKGNG